MKNNEKPKFLLLTSLAGLRHKPLFLSAAASLNVVIDVALYEEIIVEYKNNQIEIRIAGKNIDEYDLVFFRKIGEHLELATILSQYCQVQGIQIVDKVFTYERPFIDRKSFEYARVSEFNLPIIDSVFVNLQNVEEVKNKIEFPCVVKRTDGRQGDAVWLINSFDELRQLLLQQQTHLLVQDYIANEGDYRFFVIGDRVIAAMKRQSQTADFRNNISLGGEGTIYKPKEEEEKLAIDAAKAMGYDIAGVDLMFDAKSKKWFILEINRAPQFEGIMKATGIDIPKQMVEYLISKARQK